MGDQAAEKATQSLKIRPSTQGKIKRLSGLLGIGVADAVDTAVSEKLETEESKLVDRRTKRGEETRNGGE